MFFLSERFFTSWYDDKSDFDCWLSRKRILSSLKSLIRLCKCRISESWFASPSLFWGIGSNLTFFGGSTWYDVDLSSWWFELFNVILCLVKLKIFHKINQLINKQTDQVQ